MKISILGAGYVGRSLAGAAIKCGHEAMVSNSRGPQSLSSEVAIIGCEAGTVEEAAAFCGEPIECVSQSASSEQPLLATLPAVVAETGRWTSRNRDTVPLLTKAMSLYVITYTHPDPACWKKHISAHLDWLVAGVESGRLRASGDTSQTPIRSSLLIVAAPDRESACAFITTDAFVTEGLVGEMTITPWNPYFGALNSDSELPGKTAPEVAAIFRSRL